MRRCYTPQKPSGPQHRLQFRPARTEGGCIDRREFGRSTTRTLPPISGRFWVKCAEAAESADVSPPPAGRPHPFLWVVCPTSCTKKNRELQSVDFSRRQLGEISLPAWECVSNADVCLPYPASAFHADALPSSSILLARSERILAPSCHHQGNFPGTVLLPFHDEQGNPRVSNRFCVNSGLWRRHRCVGTPEVA